MEDEKIIALFFGRSEDAIRELDHKGLSLILCKVENAM